MDNPRFPRTYRGQKLGLALFCGETHFGRILHQQPPKLYNCKKHRLFSKYRLKEVPWMYGKPVVGGVHKHTNKLTSTSFQKTPSSIVRIFSEWFIGRGPGWWLSIVRSPYHDIPWGSMGLPVGFFPSIFTKTIEAFGFEIVLSEHHLSPF